jgi:hypothetical protein
LGCGVGGSLASADVGHGARGGGPGVGAARTVAVASALVYTYHVVVVYRQLRERRAALLQPPRAPPRPPRPAHTVTYTEYSSLLAALLAKARGGWGRRHRGARC